MLQPPARSTEAKPRGNGEGVGFAIEWMSNGCRMDVDWVSTGCRMGVEWVSNGGNWWEWLMSSLSVKIGVGLALGTLQAQGGTASRPIGGRPQRPAGGAWPA